MLKTGMIYLHKILPVFLSPIFIVMCLVCLSLVLRRARYGLVGLMLLWALSTPIVENSLSGLLEQGQVRKDASKMDKADAIVVLSGMITTVEGENGRTEEWHDPDRFFGGLALFEAQRAPKVIFTRGQLPWTNQSVPEGEYLKEMAVKFGVPAASIQLTENVVNTAEEATATRKLFAEGGLRPSETKPKIILVTSAFHMPRAAPLFKAQGFDVVPYPVDFKSGSEQVTMMSFLPNADALSGSSRFFREMLGRLYYSLK